MVLLPEVQNAWKHPGLPFPLQSLGFSYTSAERESGAWTDRLPRLLCLPVMPDHKGKQCFLCSVPVSTAQRLQLVLRGSHFWRTQEWAFFILIAVYSFLCFFEFMAGVPVSFYCGDVKFPFKLNFSFLKKVNENKNST